MGVSQCGTAAKYISRPGITFWASLIQSHRSFSKLIQCQLHLPEQTTDLLHPLKAHLQDMVSRPLHLQHRMLSDFDNHHTLTTLLWRSLILSLGPGMHKALFALSKHLWQVQGLILNTIAPLLQSHWCFSFALGCGASKARLEADCGSDHGLLIAKFSLKTKKVGKITRPFRSYLNQIPYDLYSASEK